MTWQTVFTLAVLAAILYGLIRYSYVVDVIFLGALCLFALTGIITPKEAVAGFSNEGMLTVAALFVVAAGLVETGVIGRIARRVMGRADSAQSALVRMLPPVIACSAFLNNTTVVAMAMPVVLEWARRQRVAPSKLLLPLSYASILGGVCTLIGTSTNLVVHGMLKSADMPGLGMWEIGRIGIPIAAAGGLLMLAMSRLLPDRKEFLEQIGESSREFLVEMEVTPTCPLIGQTIQDAGLRQLPGLFLVEIERNGESIAPVAPDERLRTGDHLTFTGVVSTIVDLQRIAGLKPISGEQGPDLPLHRGLVEAVVSVSSPLIGQTIRDANFRTIYDAAVIAVHRNGERLRQKIGDISMRPGDTLLLLAGPGFVRSHRNNPDFYLVSEAGNVSPPRDSKAWIAAGITGAMILLLTLPDVIGSLSPGHPTIGRWLDWADDSRVIFALLAAGAMIVTRCVSASAGRRSIEWQVLLVIAAAFGISKAMEKSGAAQLIASGVIDAARVFGPVGVLAGVYLVTWLLTELMSNNAAAALMFPIAIAAAAELHVDARPFAIVVCLAASAGFCLPIGYQTHLMVFGPGGYRQSDFLKLGLPMSLLWMVLSILLVPLFWSLKPVH